MFKSKIPYEKKAEIVKDYLDGRVGYAESLKRANCGREPFRRWVHLYKEKGAAGLSRATWLRPSPILCKPSVWCIIGTPHWMFY